jgi:hypothetical protein
LNSCWHFFTSEGILKIVCASWHFFTSEGILKIVCDTKILPEVVTPDDVIIMSYSTSTGKYEKLENIAQYGLGIQLEHEFLFHYVTKTIF